jgi:hypothetical protein
MVDSGLCSMRVLDCNAENPGVVYPDPRNPLATPAVACPPRLNGTDATAQPALRVYYGAQCALWRPNNGLNCSWDNVKQAFVGGGCVASDGPTQCMCRHLTDFASARVPKISTCSLSDMTSLSPGEFVSRCMPAAIRHHWITLTTDAIKSRQQITLKATLSPSSSFFSSSSLPCSRSWRVPALRIRSP